MSAQALGPQHDVVVVSLLNLAAAHEHLYKGLCANSVYQRVAHLRSSATVKQQDRDAQWMDRYGESLHETKT